MLKDRHVHVPRLAGVGAGGGRAQPDRGPAAGERARREGQEGDDGQSEQQAAHGTAPFLDTTCTPRRNTWFRASLALVRSLVAVVVALPWVVWALLRTLGVELSYPLVALIAFTPYAALTSPVPVVAALVLQAARGRRGGGGGAVALGFAMVPRAVAGPQPEARGPRLVVMTATCGSARPNRARVLRVAREHDVDVVSVQELRPRQMRRFETDDFPESGSWSPSAAPAAAGCCRGYR